jgi:hypothetical protein
MKKYCISIPCEIAIYRMVENVLATDSLPVIKYEIVCFYLMRNGLHKV